MKKNKENIDQVGGVVVVREHVRTEKIFKDGKGQFSERRRCGGILNCFFFWPTKNCHEPMRSSTFPITSKSAPPHSSTSSSNNNTTFMPPCSASNSDGIHQTFLGSLYVVLRRFISSFILFVCSSCDVCTSHGNNIVVGEVDHDQPPRLSKVDFVASLHNIYAYFTGLLLTLTGIKYQGSSTNPFSKHPTLMTLFLIAISVYIISLITLSRSNHMSDHSSKLLVGVCHICGAVACEFLLLVLVSPVRSLVINVSSLTPIVMSVLCYKYILRRILDAEEEGTGISQSDAGDQASHQMEMVDLEGAA